MSPNLEETVEHKRLKRKIQDIASTCEISSDKEVILNFTGDKEEDGNLTVERSADVVMYGKNRGKKFIFIFECKGGKNFDSINKEISSWEADIQKIQGGRSKLISSADNKIKITDLENLDKVKVCYVFGKYFDVEKFVTLSKTFQRRGFIAWNNNAVIYYNKVGRTLGKWIKYELYKEFNISFEERQICKEGAVQIRQGDWEMYLLGVYPAVLLKIGYVSRRASGKPEAYQRILNKDRIKKVSDFIKSKGAILPNAIILAFDDDKDIQGKISYTNGILKFPKIYSSAWIIDGQHRIFGFLGTKFEDTDPDDPAEEFKLPVVAFRKLDDVMQNRTFVSINYNQKKIDPTLLCDLARSVPDLTNELTWPSLLVSELNKKGSFKDRVKISELDGRRPISLSSFARYGLLEGLLGFNKKAHDYQGVLFKFAPFNDRAQLKNLKNQGSLKKQSDLLRRYFGGVEKNTTKTSPRRDPWKNIKQYSLLKPAGINALLLVLSRIMEKYPKADLDFEQYLKPLKGMKFSRSYVSQQGGGWKGFRSLANSILRKLNQKHPKDRLRIFGEKDKW